MIKSHNIFCPQNNWVFFTKINMLWIFLEGLRHIFFNFSMQNETFLALWYLEHYFHFKPVLKLLNKLDIYKFCTTFVCHMMTSTESPSNKTQKTVFFCKKFTLGPFQLFRTFVYAFYSKFCNLVNGT